MRNSHIEIGPIAGAPGAEIGGVNVARDLDNGVVGEIRQALLDWDKRCTKHLAVHDAGPFRRVTRRTKICDDAVH